MRIYNASRTLGWDDATLGEVTGVLVEAGVLSAGEAHWLRATNSAY